MKKVVLSVAVVAMMVSCSGSKAVTDSVSQYAGPAASLITTLSPNSKLSEVAKLFTMLDSNKDEALTKSEVSGVSQITDNFDTLDKDKSSKLNLSELSGLLGMLK